MNRCLGRGTSSGGRDRKGKRALKGKRVKRALKGKKVKE